MLFVYIMLLFLPLISASAFYFHALSLFISFFWFASCTVLLICLFFLILCSHRCCFYFYFLWKGYELSGEIALKNNHYYYYYYFVFICRKNEWYNIYYGIDKMNYIGHVVRITVSGYRGRRFETRQHEYVVSLSKALYLRCFSRLSC